MLTSLSVPNTTGNNSYTYEQNNIACLGNLGSADARYGAPLLQNVGESFCLLTSLSVNWTNTTGNNSYTYEQNNNRFGI